MEILLVLKFYIYFVNETALGAPKTEKIILHYLLFPLYAQQREGGPAKRRPGE
jgi:hypothetical protein